MTAEYTQLMDEYLRPLIFQCRSEGILAGKVFVIKFCKAFEYQFDVLVSSMYVACSLWETSVCLMSLVPVSKCLWE